MGWIFGTLGIVGIMGVFAMVESRNKGRRLHRVEPCNIEEGQSVRFEYDAGDGNGKRLVTGIVDSVRDLWANPVESSRSIHWKGSQRLITVKRDKAVMSSPKDNPFKAYYDVGIAEMLTVR